MHSAPHAPRSSETSDQPAPPDARAFLIVDVDGYCAGGIDQRVIVTPSADGYRARELGWAFFTADDHESGSIYFRDETVPDFTAPDAHVAHTHRMHGLPARPPPHAYGDEPVLCSSRLLDAFRIVHEAVGAMTGRPVVIVHKGGNEGLWAGQAIAGVQTLDLGAYGCPTADAIGREWPEAHVGRQCAYHAPVRRRSRRIVHCPRLEVTLFAEWIARCTAADPKGGEALG